MMDGQRKSELKQNVRLLLEGFPGLHENMDGTFSGEIDADYRDELSEETAGEICRSQNPWEAFYEMLDEGYSEYACELREQVCAEIELVLADGRFDGLSDDEREYIRDMVLELVYFDYPAEHYLKQDFCVNIMMNTGDGNYDYALNSVYPCWYGNCGERIDSKAGIVWLAGSQGYTKTQLWKALQDGDTANPEGFLDSMRVELANLPSSMSAVTFLVRMTLEQLMELNTAILWRDKQSVHYDTAKNPYCGYVILGKETRTGLFDPWVGGGSVLGIELEKDVRIPVKLIRCALPDGGGYRYEYSAGSVYGLCESAWTDSVKEIHLPKKIQAA